MKNAKLLTACQISYLSLKLLGVWSFITFILAVIWAIDIIAFHLRVRYQSNAELRGITILWKNNFQYVCVLESQSQMEMGGQEKNMNTTDGTEVIPLDDD